MKELCMKHQQTSLENLKQWSVKKSLYETFFKNLHPAKCCSLPHTTKFPQKFEILQKRQEMNQTMPISVAHVMFSSTQKWIKILTCNGWVIKRKIV